MDRSDDLTLPAETPWLLNEDTRTVCAALQAEGAPVYFVGGCVRDALLGVAGADVDLSTPILPEDVIRLAEAAGLKAVPTGIDHGTVTIVAGGKGFEVTTFRRDVATDGRRAVVSFSTDIVDDARRRDFTLNALYATADGQIIDPLGGLDDCLNRRIRFIENADTRIREDYLRILRYFRFHAWYARPGAGFDADTLDAIARNTRGLETLSSERTGAEMRRLLAAPDPVPAVAAMRQTGCLALVLPGSDDRFLGPVVHLEMIIGVAPDSLRRLAALGGAEPETSLRLSRADARQLQQVKDAAYGPASLSEIGYRNGRAIAMDALLLRAAFAERTIDRNDLAEIDAGATAVFPVSARDLMPVYQGAALGEKLASLEARWIASGFSLSCEDLMKDL